MALIASSTGVRLLLSDSTNAEEPGHAPSERAVGQVSINLFRQHEGRRIITASFACHIHRIQQIADAAIACGRVVATLGLSVKRNVRLAPRPRVAHHSRRVARRHRSDRGPSSRTGLRRVDRLAGRAHVGARAAASGDNRWLKLTSEDTVILSSHAIPGNEHNVNKVIDGLLRVGAEVVHSGVADVHATGHAQAEELKMLMALAKPELFIPVHGEFRHLMAHARLANQMGLPDSNILLAEDGDVVALSDDGIDFAGRVPAGYLYVDGIVGDVGHGVLRDPLRPGGGGRGSGRGHGRRVDRKRHHRPGDHHSGMGRRGRGRRPDRRGDRPRSASRRARVGAEAATTSSPCNDTCAEAVGRFVSERTRRKPMIVPVVMEA